MAALNLFNKQNKNISREEEFDSNYYAQEEEYTTPAADEKPAFEKPVTHARSSFSGSMGSPVQMKLIRPTTFADGEIIANHLIENHPVLIHLENTTKEVSHDLVCFLTGVVFAIRGQIQPVSEYTYMLSPEGMEITEEGISNDEGEGDDEGYGFAGFSGIGGYTY
jgi:cell division inhibitor SepF